MKGGKKKDKLQCQLQTYNEVTAIFGNTKEFMTDIRTCENNHCVYA